MSEGKLPVLRPGELIGALEKRDFVGYERAREAINDLVTRTDEKRRFLFTREKRLGAGSSGRSLGTSGLRRRN